MHGDLKSPNILLDKHYRAKLSDFGLSKLKTETNSQYYAVTKTVGAGPKGSLLWMAPELFKRRAKRTFGSDMYAVAMVMWEIASHAFPFSDDVYDRDQIKDWVIEGEREEFPENTPSSYQKIAVSCWAGKREERPSAKEVLTALHPLNSEKKVVGKLVKNQPTNTNEQEEISALKAKLKALEASQSKSSNVEIQIKKTKSAAVDAGQVKTLLHHTMRGGS